jgi:excisionase family DNA binding protein
VKLLTLKETADCLSVSLHTVRAWVARRKIEVVRIGRCVRIREEVIQKLITDGINPPKP